MRIVSLLPSATDTIAELGLLDELVGISDDCNWPPEVRSIPLVARTRVDLSGLTAAQIDVLVNSSVAGGEGEQPHSLYAVDAALMADLEPDLVITQDVCEVCAVSSGDLETACPLGVEVLSMNARMLADVITSVASLGQRLGAGERGAEIAARMSTRIEALRRVTGDGPRPRVFVAEWMDPPYGSGHWIPEMVEAAGGENLLSSPGAYSFPTTWDTVLGQQPDLIVLAACGFSVEQSLVHTSELRLPVRTAVVDGDAYYARPGPRLVDGIHQLARLLHPEVVEDPRLPVTELPPLSV